MRPGSVRFPSLRFLLPAAVAGTLAGCLLTLVDLGRSYTYLVIGGLGFAVVAGRILRDIRTSSGGVAVPPPAPTVGPRLRHGFAVASLIVVFSLVSLESFVIYLATPHIGEEFGASFSGLGWIILASLIPLTLTGLAGGQLTDLLGLRRVFLAGVVMLGVGSAGAGLASGLGFLLAFRVVQGVGAALVMTTWGGLINAVLDIRPVNLGGLMTMSALAVVVGVLGGGLLIEYLDWRALFLINVPISLFVLALGAGTLADGERTGFRGSIDLIGIGLLTLALLAFSLALTAGLPTSIPARIGLLVFAASAGIIFLFTEKRKVHPILYSFLFKRRMYLVSMIAVTGSSFGSITLLFLFTFFFQRSLGHSPIEVSLTLLAWIAASLIAQSVAAVLAIRHWRWLLVAGLVLDALGLLLMGGLGVDPGYLYLVLGLAVAGSGSAMVLVVAGAVTFDALNPNVRDWGLQSLSTARAFGGIAGLLLAGLYLQAMASESGLLATSNDMAIDVLHDVLLAAAVLVFCTAIAVAALLRSQLPHDLGHGAAETAEEKVDASLGDRLGWF